MVCCIHIIDNNVRLAVSNAGRNRCWLESLRDAVDLFCRNPVFEEMPADRSVNRARVDVDKTESVRERSRDTTFARGSWAINRDHSMKISLRRVHECWVPV